MFVYSINENHKSCVEKHMAVLLIFHLYCCRYLVTEQQFTIRQWLNVQSLNFQQAFFLPLFFFKKKIIYSKNYSIFFLLLLSHLLSCLVIKIDIVGRHLSQMKIKSAKMNNFPQLFSFTNDVTWTLEIFLYIHELAWKAIFITHEKKKTYI